MLIHIFKKDANSWFDPLSLKLSLVGWCFNYDDPNKTSNRIMVPKALCTYFTSLLLCKNTRKSHIQRSLNSSSSFLSPVIKNLFLRGRIATADVDFTVLPSSWDFSQSWNKESLLSLCLMTFTFHWSLKEGDRDPRAEERAGPGLLDGAALLFPPAAYTVVITFNFLLTVFDTKDKSNLTGSPKCLYPLSLAPPFHEQKNTNTKPWDY